MERVGYQVRDQLLRGVGVVAQVPDEPGDEQVELLVHVADLDLVALGVVAPGGVGEVARERLGHPLGELLVEKSVVALQKVGPEPVVVKEVRAEHAGALAQGPCDVARDARLVPGADG